MREPFDSLIKAAQAGDEPSIEKLLTMYDPLLDRHSFVSGIRDDDLKQHLRMRFIAALAKFK